LEAARAQALLNARQRQVFKPFRLTECEAELVSALGERDFFVQPERHKEALVLRESVYGNRQGVPVEMA
jgi:hypothetical protein